MMVRPKHQRLVLVVLALTALLGAVLLAMWGLKERAAYFYTPSEYVRAPCGDTGATDECKPVRMGGMVEKGSLRQDPNGITVEFNLTDGKTSVLVIYTGILPDLFKEGSGAVVEGQQQFDGEFHATTILAKHDERYMPPQMDNLAAAAPAR